MIVIPDFVFKNMKDKEGNYKKVEVEEDMEYVEIDDRAIIGGSTPVHQFC